MSQRLVLLMLSGAVIASALMAVRLALTKAPWGTDAFVDIVLFAVPGALAGATLHLLLKPKR